LAHDRKTDALARELRGAYEIVKRYQAEVSADDLERADCVLLYYWLQIERLSPLREVLWRLRERLVVGICSHFELGGAWRAPGLATLEEFARAVFVNNRLLLAEFGPELEAPVYYTPNGVDTEFFRPAAAPRSPSRTLRVGWAGSLTNHGAEHRGVHEFIAPAAAAAGAELCLAVREEKWRNQEEMLDFYRSLDVYVCASRSEGTPNPCLEAAACGLPVITTRVGNMPELIRDGHNGFLVAREPAAFAAALATLRDDESLRAAMAANIRADIERDWDWRQRAEGFATLFAAALAAPRGHEHADCCVRDGDELLERGDRIGARTAFQQALDADGNHALAHARLAAWWWNDAAGGAPDAALTALGHQRQALALGRDDPAVREAVAGLLQRQGRADLATALGR